MSVVRKAIEQDAKAAPDVQLLMNDSQNDQSKQNDQIDVLLAKGVKALAINLVDPAARATLIVGQFVEQLETRRTRYAV
ncbi:substrate-binding domain-containing protein, partial [Pseudomonas aeruginosa]|uniref:substrate-binding domain-containing protein n=1 Tax=Pseudomonas aeruginosa TaxID=287 RepID=UPI0031B6EC7D